MLVEGLLNPFSTIIEQALVANQAPLHEEFILFAVASTYLYSLVVREQSKTRFSAGMTTLDELVFFGGVSFLIGLFSYQTGFTVIRIISGLYSYDLITVSYLSGITAFLIPITAYALCDKYSTSIPEIFNKLKHHTQANKLSIIGLISFYYIGLTLLANIVLILLPYGDIYTFFARLSGLLFIGPIIIFLLLVWTTFYFKKS